MQRALVIIFSFLSSYFISGQEINFSGFHDLWRYKDQSIDTAITNTQSDYPVFIPNIFSPNGDGNNDLFRIQSVEGTGAIITRFFIFDRFGDNIYEQYDLPLQSPTGWWDGTSRRWTLGEGVYTYFLEIKFENGVRITYKGGITLVR